jgi:hypothetical protein
MGFGGRKYMFAGCLEIFVSGTRGFRNITRYHWHVVSTQNVRQSEIYYFDFRGVFAGDEDVLGVI